MSNEEFILYEFKTVNQTHSSLYSEYMHSASEFNVMWELVRIQVIAIQQPRPRLRFHMTLKAIN